MKKLFTFITALTAAIAMNATIVTLTPADFSAATSAATSATVEGVTASVTSGTITDQEVRIFKNQTITISCEKAISGVVFTCTANGDAKYGPGCFAAQDGYSYEGKVGVWAGTAATSVAFNASANQVRATKIEVYLDGEVPSAPTPQEAIKVTVAEAIAAGMLLDSAKTSEAVYEVTGYVVNSQPYNPTYKNQIWFMADDAANTGSQEFEAYACTVSEDNVIMQVIDGDKVKLTGNLTKYYNAAEGKFIIEIKNGTALFVEKAEGDHSLPGEVGPDTISVAQAVAIAEALAEPAENGKSTTDTKEYVVKGFAVQVYPKNDDGTWSFFMADEAGAYGPFSASNTSTDADVVENDFMLVRGKIAKRKTNAGNIQLQIYKGTGVHGVAPQGIENVTLTEKAQKVMIDGVMYIVRDNKMFNLQGAQVR